MRYTLLISALALSTFACSAQVEEPTEETSDSPPDADEVGSSEEFVATSDAALTAEDLRALTEMTARGGTLTLKAIPGLVWGPSASRSDAVKNAALLTSFFARTAQTDKVRSGLTSGTATLSIAPNGRFIGPLVRLGSNDAHDVDLRDVKLQLFRDVQPDTKNNSASLVEVNGQSDAKHKWWLDGNCPNQTIVSGTWHNAGLYHHGLRFFDSERITLDAQVDDICGVTGNTIKQTDTHPEGPNETFHVQFLRGPRGGHDVTLRMANTGVAPTKPFHVQEGSSSGLVFQHWDGAKKTDPAVNQISHVTATISKLRHGIGGYQAGRLHVRGDTVVADCEHNLNFEIGAHDAKHSWQNGALGYSVGDVGKFVTLDGRGGATDIQLQCNFNGDTLRQNVSVEGLVTIGGKTAFEIDGIAKDGDSLADVPQRFDIKNSWVLSPTQNVVKLTGTAAAYDDVAKRIFLRGTRLKNDKRAKLVTLGALGANPITIP